jgi:diguanylate cyclase (GGDEF)-like protein/PAS domain S-box-containing protein
MYRILYCLKDQHDWKLVLLAAAVCIFSSVVAVLTIERAQSTSGAQRIQWVLTAGAAGGFGIWATHFIAMLAYNPGVNTGYDLRLTLLSLICAIGLSAGGIEIGISRGFRYSSLAGGAVLGAGIAAMHFLGMMALDLPGRIIWAPDLVSLAIGFAVTLSAATMWAVNQPTGDAAEKHWPGNRWITRAAPLLLTLAIVSLHFTAMGAITVRPDPTRAIGGLALSPGSMSLAITMAAIAVLALCAFAVISGRRLDLMRDESNRRFRVLLEGLEDTAIFLLDPQGRVTDWNAGGDRNNGYPIAEITGRVYADVCAVDADFPARYREALKQAELEGRAELEGPARRADGKPFWGQTLLRALRDGEGKLLGFANITHEITERKAAENAVKTTARQLDAALSNMPMGLCLFDRNERLILANHRFIDFYKLDESLVQPGVSFRTLLVAIMNQRDERPDESTIEAFHARHRELIALPSGGAYVSDYFPGRVMSISHRPMADGGWVSTFEDITERRASEARIQHMARHDALTGLPNRTHFNDAFEIELARAGQNGEYLGMVAFDIAQFKEINDRLGHQAGDEVLKKLAGRLVDHAHVDGRLVARFGGDEFNSMRRFKRLEDLRDAVQKLYDCTCEPIRIGDEDIVLTINMGISIYPQDGQAREVLLNNADLAMQRAKTVTGRALCYYDAAMDEAARERNAIAKDLKRALKDEEFRLFYQVQQSVISGGITGYEALIRWKHPVRGFISPADFISVAEDCGAIVEIGAWVLRTACREAVSWGTNLKIAVNLSPVQLNDVSLIETVRQVLIETGLSPSRLELEITESTIIGDKAHALHLLRQIKALGVTIAIDDFGTGYASLDTLNSFPFDKIKIDRSFLMEADKSAQARAIVRAILALGKSLEIPVLAEGVETEAQLGLLREEGCEEAQGYLLGRPVEFIGAVKAA